MLREFKKFAFKGNLIDLAVGFILGIAFSSVVTSLVEDIFMPVIGAIVSDQSLAALTVEVGGAEVRYGNFLAVFINFLLIAWILFLVVRAANRMRPQQEEMEEANTKACPFCVSLIPLNATRCPSCTSDLS